MIYDLFEVATSMRMMHNFFRIRGVAVDLPYGWVNSCRDFCDYFLLKLMNMKILLHEIQFFLNE
jgi:NAD(P)H-quinone oxidoreductase subunit H